MKLGRCGVAITLAVGVGVVGAGDVRSAGGEPAGKAPRDYPVQPVPFTAVRFTDAFWRPRIEVNRTVTIPFAFEKCEETKRVFHFERAAAVLRGEALLDRSPPGYPFDDTDVYKVIEGAAYTLSVQPDPELERRGPLVYAAEWPDNPGGKVRNLLLPDGATLSSQFRPGLLNGVQVVTGRAVALAHEADAASSTRTARNGGR